MHGIAAVILAAGGSSRFGKPKQLLQFRGKTLLRAAIDAASSANCFPIVVVIGSGDHQIVRQLVGSRAIAVQNENWRRGLGTSIRCGMERLVGTNASAVVLLVCDQPLVDATAIKNLIAVREQTNQPIVAAAYGGTVGVPALFDQAYFRELLQLADEEGAKRVILANRDQVAEFSFPQGNRDIDTTDEWQKFQGGEAIE